MTSIEPYPSSDSGISTPCSNCRKCTAAVVSPFIGSQNSGCPAPSRKVARNVLLIGEVLTTK